MVHILKTLKKKIQGSSDVGPSKWLGFPCMLHPHTTGLPWGACPDHSPQTPAHLLPR